MEKSYPIQFNNSYIKLPEQFFSHQAPTPTDGPQLIRINDALAAHLGIDPDWLHSDDGIAFLAGNHIPEGADPIATVYGGHQFGHWADQLGDGRAILMGEVIGKDNKRYDIQLKGAGQTPYSRQGDGRAPLGPVLREYLISEAMAALGIASTRSLAAVTTGETVWRQTALPGAILTRVAQSHIRIGTFELFAARQDSDALRALADHVLARHYPEVSTEENPYQVLLLQCMTRQASLIASWQCIGFIHGVMNTDNMLLSGDTIDYGPCAFMDAYAPDTVFSSIDHRGRYAYQNQPGIAQWNIKNLAECLIPLLHTNQEQAIQIAQETINTFPDIYKKHYIKGMSKKLGLQIWQSQDQHLLDDLLDLMHQEKADFTLTFRALSDLANPQSKDSRHVKDIYQFTPAFSIWLKRWQQRIAQEDQEPASRQRRMYHCNPAFIPRNHVVEDIIEKANHNDFAAFQHFADALLKPFELQQNSLDYARAPQPDEKVCQTFCGT